ncbi:hypothetical protein A3F37_04245 [Candidatus Saccharibacteria bacterium RIFCSPHIGHO2_12_FULL_41_12]|nr:MAG: hypothetical protein A3F37_04245 [Candidatus Saccharibacteria bacterium RIFCSPHIGHO2_12_FULL_41_12]
MKDIVLIAHNIRSTHNVGSLLRTAECLGVNDVYLTGYTPYPKIADDPRLPHLANKIHNQIAKTSLGAEQYLQIIANQSLSGCINVLKRRGYEIVGLEQTNDSIDILDFKPPKALALIVGNERYGIDNDTLKLCDKVIQIPMKGRKESLNVVQATAVALYGISYLKTTFSIPNKA